MVECVFYAAGGVGDSEQGNALQSVLHHVSEMMQALHLEVYAMDRAA